MGDAFEEYMMGAIVKVAEDNIRLCKENKERSRRLDEAFKKKFGIKEDDMEKKKMTKAEAFEWLKGKRVVCDVFNDEDVQRKLFEVGIRWRSGKADVKEAGLFLFINPDGITHCESKEWFDLHEYEEISVDDILSIEIVEDTKPDCERNEHVKALQELIAKSECIDCIIISKNDFGILKK